MIKIIKLSYLMSLSALLALSALAAGIDVVLNIDNQSSCELVKINEAATNIRLSAPSVVKAKASARLVANLYRDGTWFSKREAFSNYGVSCSAESKYYDAFFVLKVRPAEYGDRLVLCWSPELFNFMDMFPDDYEFVDRNCVALNSFESNIHFSN